MICMQNLYYYIHRVKDALHCTMPRKKTGILNQNVPMILIAINTTDEMSRLVFGT